MLKQRILTALWLLSLMLGMLLYAPIWLWAVFCGLIAMLASWGCARVSGLDKLRINHYLVSTLVLDVIAYADGWQSPNLVWYIILAFWLIVMSWWLKAKWKLNGGWQAYTVGWLLAIPFRFALAYLRPQPEDAPSSLAIMSLAWVAGIGTYFCGKSFGRRKITPTISPGKSWKGAIGGALYIVVYMTIVWKVGWLAFEVGWFKTTLIGLILTVVSTRNDLLGSWLKRAAGIKDSSNLLPGHSGVFDCVDSLIAAIGIYAALVYLF